MLEMTTWDWGYTMIAPGARPTPERFSPSRFFQPWDLSDGNLARLRDDIAIPIEPFHGVLGVAPGRAGRSLDHPAPSVRRQPRYQTTDRWLHALAAD